MNWWWYNGIEVSWDHTRDLMDTMDKLWVHWHNRNIPVYLWLYLKLSSIKISILISIFEKYSSIQ